MVECVKGGAEMIYKLENIKTKEIIEVTVVKNNKRRILVESDGAGNFFGQSTLDSNIDPNNFRISFKSPLGQELVKAKQKNKILFDGEEWEVLNIVIDENDEGTIIAEQNKEQNERQVFRDKLKALIKEQQATQQELKTRICRLGNPRTRQIIQIRIVNEDSLTLDSDIDFNSIYISNQKEVGKMLLKTKLGYYVPFKGRTWKVINILEDKKTT